MTATSSGQMCAVSVCVCSLKLICDAQEMPHAQYPMESCIVEVCCIAQIATHTCARRDPSMYIMLYAFCIHNLCAQLWLQLHTLRIPVNNRCSRVWFAIIFGLQNHKILSTHYLWIDVLYRIPCAISQSLNTPSNRNDDDDDHDDIAVQ